jgi:hypothetical protein
VLPEQGRGRVTVRSRALPRRHGVATSSARTIRLGYLTLSAGCGYSPAQVATARCVAFAACRAVAAAA